MFSFSSPQFHRRKQKFRILPKAKIWQVIFGVSVLLLLRIGCKWAGQNKRAGDLQVVVCSVTVLAILADEYRKEARTKQKWIIVGCT